MRWRPPAAKVRVSCQTPSSSREESHSTSSRSTPRSRRRSETRSARLHRAGAAAADGALLGDLRDVLALGEHRALEAAHLLDGPARAVGDLLGGQAAADQRLHLARSQATVDLDLQLAQAGPVATGRGTQRLVEAEAVAAAVGVREQEVLAVLVDADEAKVLHVGLPELLVVETTVPSRGAG